MLCSNRAYWRCEILSNFVPIFSPSVSHFGISKFAIVWKCDYETIIQWHIRSNFVEYTHACVLCISIYALCWRSLPLLCESCLRQPTISCKSSISFIFFRISFFLLLVFSNTLAPAQTHIKQNRYTYSLRKLGISFLFSFSFLVLTKNSLHWHHYNRTILYGFWYSFSLSSLSYSETILNRRRTTTTKTTNNNSDSKMFVIIKNDTIKFDVPLNDRRLLPNMNTSNV